MRGSMVNSFLDLPYDLKIVLAESFSTDPSILEELSKDEDIRILGFLASNPKTPPTILFKLLKLRDYGVLRRLSGNIKAPPELLEDMVDMVPYRWTIKFRIAVNPNTSMETLHRLVLDDDKDVKKIAKEVYNNRKQQGEQHERSNI
jgi:hypothetical protein